MAGAASSLVASLPLPPFLLPEPVPTQQQTFARSTSTSALVGPAAAMGTGTSRLETAQQVGAADDRQLGPRVAMRHLAPAAGAVSGSSSSQASSSRGWLDGLLSAFGLAPAADSSNNSGASSAAASTQPSPSPIAYPAAAAAPGGPPAAAAALQAAAAASRAAELAGVWQKDVRRSDAASYERALDLWQLSPLHKAGGRLIEGLRISHGGGRLTIAFLTILPENLFKVGGCAAQGVGRVACRTDARTAPAAPVPPAPPTPTGTAVLQLLLAGDRGVPLRAAGQHGPA
jgi:hypothetical protein